LATSADRFAAEVDKVTRASAAAPRAGAGETRWEARPWLARSLRLAILAAPLILCTLVTEALAHAWRPATHRYLWIACLGVVAIAVGVGTERLARRFLPLATLLQLTLLFPDRAPSRLKVARTAGSGTRLAERLSARTDDSAGNAAENVLTLITALGNHDRKTRGHSERVRLFTDMIAAELHLSERDRDRLRWASLLHDVGKLQIAATILNKPDKLSADEYDAIRRHPAAGAELAGPLLPWLGEWGRGIVEHHERWDGRGYPRGLTGTDISRSGRIINVADAFETMTAARAYKKPLAMRAARAELARCAGSQFDPEYVRAFLAISLPRLLWGVGPLSFAGQLPFLRALATAGNRAASLGGQVSAATAGVAAVTSLGVAAAVGVPAATAPQAHDAHPHHVAVAVAQHHRVTPAKVAVTHRRQPPTKPSHPPVAKPRVSPTPKPVVSPAPTATPTPTPSSTPTSPATTPSSTPPSTPATTPPITSTPTKPTVTVPGAPTQVSAAAGDATAALTWKAPSSDGGSKLLRYTVSIYDDGAPNHHTATTASINGSSPRTKTVSADVTSTTIASLTDGDSYRFTVTATNSVGDSPASDASSSVIPAPAPTVADAPTGATAIAGDGTATVSWTAPDSDGGSPVTRYTVIGYDDGVAATTQTVGGELTSAAITGLTDGDAYTFTVTATNNVGESAPSAPSAAVTPQVPATVPGAPTAVTATAGDATATVLWTAPDSDGGSPLTRYTVTAYDGAIAARHTQVGRHRTSTTITGLTNGDTYTFTVTATNSVGDSAPSDASPPVTPTAPVTTLGLAPVYAFDVPAANVVIHVLAGAPAGIDPSTLRVRHHPDHGSAVANSDGTITYTAVEGWTGTATFTFSACTTTSACGTQTATVYVLGGHEHGLDLSGQDLAGANLAGVRCYDCDVSGADLSGANLTGAAFIGSNLTNTNFTDADLTDATLYYDDVNNVVLNGANLSGATLVDSYGGQSPQVSNITLTTPKSTSVNANVLTSVSDPDVPIDVSSLALAPGSQPRHGSVTVHSNGTITYTPRGGHTGTDRFDLVISNELGYTSTILVTVTVPP
jgi:outer membrane biosynthesis protein TonB